MHAADLPLLRILCQEATKGCERQWRGVGVTFSPEAEAGGNVKGSEPALEMGRTLKRSQKRAFQAENSIC